MPKTQTTASSTFDDRYPPGFPTCRQFFLILFGYFAVQVMLRVWLSPSTDLDESEQLVLTQQFNWGYGSQPPLYTWVQILFFQVFGVSILALALFKNLLLFGTFSLTYASARYITRSHIGGVAAAASLLFIPQIAWESQRDLTHSVLSSTAACATLYSFLRLIESRRTLWYVIFGAVAGIGLLAKYNYLLWLAALLIAGISVRESRPVILNPRSLIAGAIALLLFFPHACWIARHHDLALMSVNKLGLEKGNGWLAGVGIGLGNLFVAAGSFLGPLLLVYLGVFFKQRRSQAPRLHERLLLRAAVAVAALLLVLVFGFHAANIRERWLQPILVFAPVLLVALFREALDSRRLRWLMGLAGAVMLAVAILLPARVLFAEHIKREERLARPYPELAAQLRAPIPEGSQIITEKSSAGGNLLAGNIRLNLPGRLAFSYDLAPLFPTKSGRTFLVWDATRRDDMPEALRAIAAREVSASNPDPTPRFYSATYHRHHSKALRLGVLQVR